MTPTVVEIINLFFLFFINSFLPLIPVGLGAHKFKKDSNQLTEMSQQ